jgi:hypothetical protein
MKVILHNTSDGTIDSIIVGTSSGSSKLIVTNLQAQQTKEEFLDMKNEPDSAGNYFVTYRVGSGTFYEPCGSFTNGKPGDEALEAWLASNFLKCKMKDK